MDTSNLIQLLFVVTTFILVYIYLKVVFNNNSELSKKLLISLTGALILSSLFVVLTVSLTSYEQIVLSDFAVGFFLFTCFSSASLSCVYNNVEFNMIYTKSVTVINITTMLLAITNRFHGLFFVYSDYNASKYYHLEDITRVVSEPTVYFKLLLVGLLVINVIDQILLFTKVKNKRDIKYIAFTATVLVACILYLYLLIDIDASIYRLRYVVLVIIYQIICLSFISLRYELNAKVNIIKHYVIESFDTPLIVIRNDKRIVKYNKSASQIFESLNDVNTVSINDVREIINFENESFDILETSLIDICRRDQSTMYFKVSVSNIKVAKLNEYKLIALDDVTSIRMIEQDLQKLTYIDQLTNLYNRQHFNDIGEQLLDDMKENHDNVVAVFMLDIDFFKSINDTYGHIMGDEFLIQISKILYDVIQEYGYVGRYGGEEFCGILSLDTEEKVVDILEILRTSIENNFVKVSNTESKNATVSIGFCLADSSAHLDELLKCADSALYDAKHMGRNRVEKYAKNNVGMYSEEKK